MRAASLSAVLATSEYGIPTNRKQRERRGNVAYRQPGTSSHSASTHVALIFRDLNLTLIRVIELRAAWDSVDCRADLIVSRHPSSHCLPGRA